MKPKRTIGHFLTHVVAAAAISICVGCKTMEENKVNTISGLATRETTGVLCIGMENSARFGACPGAKIDAERMFKILSEYSNDATIFISEKAKRAKVVETLKRICKRDLAILFYSGHGGDQKQTIATHASFEEASGKDQFLCLYDEMLLDDEIWDIICESKGRVVMIFDCCHSGTMYRSPSPMAFEAKVPNGLFGASGKTPNLLCISGCPDDAFSYGDANGGLLTNAILMLYSKDCTYDNLWKLLHINYSLNKSKKVQFTEIGESFKNFPLFK